ncbi:hypothetical protein TTHERM_00343520 (macronuclear) [Tetrahymena thermophila SB210]|uniref:PCI domain protein n=1 Tax=Tetrahymena thermophila (strain SB210) TaxID=312017 RepID=I7LVF9_TETTS|nr:hypothetical protein TTHERM_00343520 [Tetrahymena thermophila SB210]EAR98153.2 hypothetical protein TTHERM_00343520 [Tetrahymena thermophila SB210]|eukprot:XP_001018398.2 hypothetical protein TTHERM_00343520 [Tetrahymena thermophila SB210]
MSNQNYIIEIFSYLKEGKVYQMVNKFDDLDSLKLNERENLMKNEQHIKEQVNQKFRIEEIDEPFINFLFLYVKWLIDKDQTNYYDPYKILIRALDQLKNMLSIMKSNQQNLMKFITHFIQVSKIISKKALDFARQNRRDENKFMSELEQHFQTWISTINKQLKDQDSQFKKQIILKIYNIQLGIRFQKYDYPGCSSIVNHTKNYQTLPNPYLNQEPISQRVLFMYYFGRLQIFSQNFKQASTCLQYALDRCPADAFKQRRQILKYLIPVNMYCGKFPTSQLIKKYELFEYSDLAIAILEGNMKKLEEQREKWKKCWIKRSLYLFIGMLETLTIRNLCKRVIQIMEKLNDGKTFNIEINKFKLAFEFSAKRPFEEEEVACLLGNLFYQQQLYGYVHKGAKGTLVVLSPKNACPKFKS